MEHITVKISLESKLRRHRLLMAINLDNVIGVSNSPNALDLAVA